jgi:hypothetical protein
VTSNCLQLITGALECGIAMLDQASRRITICSFGDDEFFCQLEMALVQLGPKECVVVKARCTLCLLFDCCKQLFLNKDDIDSFVGPVVAA